ncbi:MAG: glycosyltransferase family 9 protein [Candidatus Aminicenantes bacterium]|nr:glycosyltransferase family 9 protein [Candidatus Aminicenantes bacterium]
MRLRPDCVHFRGDKPCVFNRLCRDCPHFAAFPTRILIIKCRAMGDVLRTTPLLPSIKRKYPLSHITWLADGESADLLRHNPHIDRLLAFDLETVLLLLTAPFDLLLSLDKEPGPAALAMKVNASEKRGFGLNASGNLTIFNPAAEYAYRLGVDDELKFHKNRKSYQEIIHEAVELPYARDEYVFELPEKAKEKARVFFKRRRLSRRRPAIGLNTGSGSKFETKQWPAGHFLRLISLLAEKTNARVFLLGGPREKELNRFLARKSRSRAVDTGTDHSLLEFAGFISFLDLVVTSDTLGMHLAIALKKPVVALFGSTSPQEIELYGRGSKIFLEMECSPCYRQTCPDPRCMTAIRPERVLAEIRKFI